MIFNISLSNKTDGSLLYIYRTLVYNLTTNLEVVQNHDVLLPDKITMEQGSFAAAGKTNNTTYELYLYLKE